MVRALRSAMAVTAGLGFLACSLSTSLDGLTNPPDAADGATGDAAGGAGDDAAIAAADATPSDAASNAANADADAAIGACNGFFCDDFSRPAANLKGTWTKLLKSSEATLAIDPGGFLAAQVTAVDNSIAALQLNRGTPPPLKTFARYTFDVRWSLPSSGGTHTMALYVKSTPTATTNIVFQVREKEVTVFEQLFTNDVAKDTFQIHYQKLDGTAFHHIVMELRVDQSPPHILVKVDGVDSADVATKTGILAGSTVNYIAGISYTASATHVDVDNIVLEEN